MVDKRAPGFSLKMVAVVTMWLFVYLVEKGVGDINKVCWLITFDHQLLPLADLLAAFC